MCPATTIPSISIWWRKAAFALRSRPTKVAEQGVPIIEVLRLDELARDGVYEFAFFGAPLKLRGSTGSPLRPWAMPLR